MRKHRLVIAFVAGCLSFSSVASIPNAPVHFLGEQFEKYRITQNVLVTLAATLGHLATDDGNFLDDNNGFIITGLVASRLPALALGAMAEDDLSMAGEISDAAVLLSISGSLARLLINENDNHEQAYIIAFFLNNLIVTYVFNAFNHAVKEKYPLATDTIKRRLMRVVAVVLGNLIVPALFYSADSLQLFSFSSSRTLGMISVFFLVNTLAHVAAEVAGHIIAEYIKEEGAIIP